MPPRKPPYLLLAFVFFFLSLLGFFVFQKINLPAPAPVASPYYPQLPSPHPSLMSTPAPTSSLPLPTPTPTSIPTHLNLDSPQDGFSVSYSRDRQLHQDEHKGTNRYTLYSADGSFAIHVGPDWSWFHPAREFTPAFQVDGQNTFRYDINLQTIVDIDRGDRKYTIQCIHNAKPELQAECAALLASFKFL